jgi:hypothetical protein
MLRPHDAGPVDSPASPAVAPVPAAPQTDPEPAAERVWESDANCPFHTVMTQLAQVAVTQQVLYLGGEQVPRPDLADSLEGWHQLYRLVRTHVCPATRAAALTSADVTTLVDTALPQLLPARLPRQLHVNLRRQLIACASCASPQQCPLSFSQAGQIR